MRKKKQKNNEPKKQDIILSEEYKKSMEKHCNKCSYETEEGLAVTGCAYCGCHNKKSLESKKK